MRYERLNISKNPSADQRTPGQRDRDRILYSSPFRRLAGVTQVVSATGEEIFHNRLTHSLKVAQIARRLAEHLGKQYSLLESKENSGPNTIDPDVVEAAALAHDLGHPPFGHVAEKTLSDLLDEYGIGDGYEGNAQSFRVITRLAFHREDYEGLDLTRATLNAVMKYPWFRATDKVKGSDGPDRTKKFGAYRHDQRAFEFARSGINLGEEKCLEAQIMDWADDITYAVHDMEDFFNAGLIPLVRLAAKGDDERDKFLEEAKKSLGKGKDVEEYKKAFANLAVGVPVDSSTRARGFDVLKPMTAVLVANYLKNTRVEINADGKANLKVDENYKMEVELLKQLTWHYVILSPELATQQHGCRKIIKELHNTYTDAIAAKKLEMVPKWFVANSKWFAATWEWATDNKKNSARCAADIISSLTDKQALMYYERLLGVRPGSVVAWT